MQTTRTNGFKIILLPFIIMVALIIIDQVTKTFFHINHTTGGVTDFVIIKGFLDFSYLENTGSAFGFLNNKDWAQTFFKILTIFALFFFCGYFYTIKDNYKTLRVGSTLVIAGTIGNFIDRLSFNYVVDFIEFTFGSYQFATFNLADAYLCVGIGLILIHYLFLDDERLFSFVKDKK